MSVDDVFKKNNYVSIMYLIDMANKFNRKITLHHLKFALVKNHDIDLRNRKIKQNFDDFFELPVQDKTKKHYMLLHKIGEISKIELENKIIRNQILQLKRYGWLKNRSKYSTVQNLVNHLKRMKTLGLIKSKKSTKQGSPYYYMTKNGMKEYYRFYINFLIDRMSFDEVNKMLENCYKINERY